MANSDGSQAQEVMLDAVRAALARVDGTLRACDIAPSSSLIDDLGLDSAKLMDLMFTLEELLELPEIPMMEWFDTQRAATGTRFTVASLATYCQDLLGRS